VRRPASRRRVILFSHALKVKNIVYHHDPILGQINNAGDLQFGQIAANSLNREPKVVGDVDTHHRQMEHHWFSLFICVSAGQCEQERGHLFHRRFLRKHNDMVLHDSKFASRVLKQFLCDLGPFVRRF
jgi:hypothetical protein